MKPSRKIGLAIRLAAVMLAGSAAAEPQPTKAARPVASAVAGARNSPPLTVDRLSRMKPDERAKMLQKLPPERRASLEKRLSDFERMTPAQQARVRERLEKLNSLPQPRRSEVMRSVREFSTLPADRKKVINQELQRMSGMPEDERMAYANTNGFRNRFSPTERQLIEDLRVITPRKP